VRSGIRKVEVQPAPRMRRSTCLVVSRSMVVGVCSFLISYGSSSAAMPSVLFMLAFPCGFAVSSLLFAWLRSGCPSEKVVTFVRGPARWAHFQGFANEGAAMLVVGT
jgi:hypothetical protein